MSGPLDPTRITTFELTKSEVVVKVKDIVVTKMIDDWEWDLEPFSRANPPPDIRICKVLEYSFRHNSSGIVLTGLISLFQNFTRQAREAPAAFTADRTELDEEDPDSIQNTPLDKMDPNLNASSGKIPALHPSRTWADDVSSDDDVGSDDDDCIMLEVYDPVPISYAYSMDPASADPDAQVLEDTLPLAAPKTAASKTTHASKKITTPDSGPSAPLASKHRKVGSLAPLGAKKRSRAPPTSSG
jgi:hypothetical protein